MKEIKSGKMIVDEEISVKKVAQALAAVWVERWTEKEYFWQIGLGVFFLLTVLTIVFTIFYVAALVIFQSSSATILHANLIDSLFRCPMKFFDSVPVGRIMNRCGKDVDVVDNRLPMVMSNVVYFISLFTVSLMVELYVTPFYIIPFVPILGCYFFIQVFYVRSSRQLRRLESISRSPIYSFLQESFLGSSIIRSYKQTDRFCHQFDQMINVNSVAQLTLASTNGWLGIYLDTIGSLMVGAAALLGVIQRSHLLKGSVGLSLVTMLMMTELLQWGVKEIGLLETEAVALERIAEYVKTEHEAEWSNAFGLSLKGWPSSGSIEFKCYSTSYRPGTPLVIKNFTCKIDGGQKIGIVGRTGAGKSSITVAIFRLIEAVEGKIFIDNVDISLFGLHDLRKKLTIIPQDPVLFSGTLRSNIDPFNEFADDQLWSIIEISKMKKKVEDLPDKLNFKISECGQNMSVGERQVVCLWRALLRKSKILILDEATAAVDMKMDALIQDTIKKNFNDCTVITIAHRLNTIMDSSKIMVLESGALVEYDKPEVLLKDRTGKFYQMIAQATQESGATTTTLT